MTVEIHSRFEIVVKRVHLKVFTWVRDVVVLCLHSCTIVTLSRVHSNVLSEEGGVDFRLVIPIQLRVILFK